MKKSLLSVVFLLSVLACLPQDITFSQINHSKLTYNPGFAGSKKLNDLILSHRNFSPSGFGNYLTYRASFNTYLDRINGGIALQFIRDDQGQGAISRSFISAMYAYSLRIQKNMTIHPALEAKYATYSLNTRDLIFPDMFNRNTWQVDGDPEVIGRRSDSYLDFSAGFRLNYRNEYLRSFRDWTLALGVSHLNKPASLLNKGQELPRRWMLYFDMEIFLKYLETYQSSTVLIPVFFYTGDKNHHQFQYGTYLKYKKILAGAFIRHDAEMNYLTPVFQLGVSFSDFRLDYSYDAGFVNIKRSFIFSGAHEVTLSINLSIKGRQ
jgi:type IX secretion system PorP/SprF family membrane protein